MYILNNEYRTKANTHDITYRGTYGMFDNLWRSARAGFGYKNYNTMYLILSR